MWFKANGRHRNLDSVHIHISCYCHHYSFGLFVTCVQRISCAKTYAHFETYTHRQKERKKEKHTGIQASSNISPVAHTQLQLHLKRWLTCVQCFQFYHFAIQTQLDFIAECRFSDSHRIIFRLFLRFYCFQHTLDSLIL